MKIFDAPPALVSERNNFWTMGWEVSKLDSVLAALSCADMTVDASALPGNTIWGLNVSLVGSEATKRENVVGYRIIASHRFGSSA